MTKTFSTKLDPKVLRLLETFCRKYHLKKSHVLQEIITEGIKRRMQTLELVQSLQRGLEDEEGGNLISAREVEQQVFGKRKAA